MGYYACWILQSLYWNLGSYVDKGFYGSCRGQQFTIIIYRSSYKLKRDKEKITKILSKILALRAEKIIPIIIYSDQTGFVKNRNPLGNIRWLLRLIWSNKLVTCPMATLTWCSEGLWQRWMEIFKKRFGYGWRFIRWLNLIYTNVR